MSYLLCFVAIMAYFQTFPGFVAATESRSRGFCHVIYSFGIAKVAVQPLCVAVCQVTETCCSLCPAVVTLPLAEREKPSASRPEHTSGVDFLWKRSDKHVEGEGSTGNSMTHAARDRDRINEILRKISFSCTYT